MKIIIASISAFIIIVSQNAYAKCAGERNPCQVDNGIYHLELPEKRNEKPIPLVVFLHGAGGSGQSVMGNRYMIKPMLKRGYAVMAPTGGKTTGSRFPYMWNFYPQFENMRNDMEFLPKVVKDAAQRFGTSKTKVLLAGFSAGAFMVSYLACQKPNSFAAYAPVAGGFWRPHPEKCNGPINLFQTHGWDDKIVPLEGRILSKGKYVQGDIFKTLDIWRKENKCALIKPDETKIEGVFWMRKWEKCKSKMPIHFALHQGHHYVPNEWGDVVLDWFEEVVN